MHHTCVHEYCLYFYGLSGTLSHLPPAPQAMLSWNVLYNALLYKAYRTVVWLLQLVFACTREALESFINHIHSINAAQEKIYVLHFRYYDTVDATQLDINLQTQVGNGLDRDLVNVLGLHTLGGYP